MGCGTAKTEFLCGPHVDDQLEPRRPQDGKVVRLGAAQNLAGVYADLAVDIGEASAMAHQPAFRWELPDVS